jgi:hypothetical protein
MIENLTIYLCGPINGRTDTDCKTWREEVKQLWPGKCLDPMRRDYRGRELEPGITTEIVAGDLEDIAVSHGLLVFYDTPSVGTAMEIFHAKYNLGKPVVVIDVSDRPPSPWLLHHADKVVPTVEIALGHLLALCARRA